MGITYNPRIVTNGLVLCFDAANRKSYPGSGTTWTDLSGNSNTGTLTNGPTYSSANGGYLVFNGTNNYVLLSRPVQDDFTLSCWFKTTQSFTTYTSGSFQWYQGAGLVDCEVGGVTNDFGLSLNAAKASFGTGSPDTTIQSSSSYNDNVWHYAVATRIRSSGAIVLYVDGTLVASGTGGTNSLTTATQLRIGSLQTNINFFSGNISQVSVYSRALTAAEVSQNFNALRGRYGI
jgi:hypothetical protein